MSENVVVRQKWPRWVALLVGVTGLALFVGLGMPDGRVELFRAYLVAFLFWTGISLGCLVVLMVHHLVGGGWGFLIRRLLEAGTGTLFVMAVLLVPLLFGVHDLYAWSHADLVASDALLQHRQAYLNPSFFVVRAVTYFVLWLVLAYLLGKWSAEQDRTGSPEMSGRLYVLSGPGIAVYGITMSLAAIDWVMSLEPDWYSTAIGAIVMVGQALSALAFVALALGFFAAREPLSELASPRYLNDLSNLLLAFVMLWAYLAFSQFLIIWSGNLADEVGWYVRRLRHGWQFVGAVLVACHFAVPFLLLLSRRFKQDVRSLAALGGALLTMRLVDLWWTIDPAFHPDTVRLPWMTVLAVTGIGGLWMSLFLVLVERRPLLPLADPDLPQVLAGAFEAVP